MQLAKHLGAQVATTCSPHNEGRVRTLGADQVINYREHNFDEVLEPQDVIYEMMGFESRERALRVLKPGGRLVSINGGLVPLAKKHGPLGGTVRAVCNLTKFSIRARLRHSIQVSNVIRKPNGDHLAKLTALLEEGALKACVDRVYPLDEIAQAHQYSQSGHAQGKIVIDLT